MPNAREKAADNAATIYGYDEGNPDGGEIASCSANLTSDLWEPQFLKAIQLIEKYERAMWLMKHQTFRAYRDSQTLWELKEFVNG